MKRILAGLFLFALMWTSILLPRLPKLDQFVAVDEPAWLVRSANFYYALGQRDFARTFQSIHPGVTTMWIETAAFLIKYPQYRGFGQGYIEGYRHFDVFMRSKGMDPHQILIISRIIAVLICSLMLLLSALILKSFVKTPTLIAIVIMIGFDPFYMAYSRLAHLDGLESSFLFLSFIACYAYLRYRNRVVYLLLSGGAAAFAVLTRITGILIIPVVFGMFLLELMDKYPHWRKQNESWQGFVSEGRGTFLGLIYWSVFFLGALVLFWPAVWVDPLRLVSLFTSPMNFASALATDPQIRLSSAGVNINLVFFRSYVWNTTPVTLTAILLALISYFGRFGQLNSESDRRLITASSLFVAVFFGALALSSKFSMRYSMPAYLVLDVVAAYGIASIPSILSGWHLSLKNTVSVLIQGGMLLIYAVGTLQTFPYYLTYYNPLLGGSRRAGETLFIGYGEGLDEAGRYLAQKPNADQLTAIAWYGWGCFSYYFPGETNYFSTYLSWADFLEKQRSKKERSDYLVVYTNQWYRRQPPELFDILDKIKPEHSVWINDIEYVRIYKVSDIPLP